jgi:peptide/nickel transport system substrate-binding protein
MVAAAAVLGLGCAAAAVALDGRDESTDLGRIAGNAVGLIDPGDGRITEQYGVGRGPKALVAGGGSTWVANATDNTVTRIDPGHELVAIPVGTEPGGLAFAGGALWVTRPRDRSVSQVVPATNALGRRIVVGNEPRAIVAAYGSLWVTSGVDRRVIRIDLARGAVADRIPVGANPTAIAAGAGAIWVTSEEGGAVFRLDRHSGAATRTINVGNGPAGIAVGEGAVWVANRQDGTVSRIDPRTESVVDLLRVGRAPTAIAAGAGAVWVANTGAGTVSRIDPVPGRPVRTIPVHGSPSAIGVVDDRVWATALIPPAGHRGGTLRVEMPPDITLDTGKYDTSSQPISSTVYDGLLAYRRVDGEGFGTLVPDLATAVPTPSADGKTYNFTLRPGIRFSNGRTVQPEDFRASMERLLRVHGTHLPPFFDGIPGARTCVRRPARCDLSGGIVTDARARTITIRLTAPDPDLVHKLAFPLTYVVPPDHPYSKRGRPPPGTGPYRFAGFRFGHSARLVRNPYFRVWAPDDRPDGIVDEIHVRFSKKIAGQVAAVEHGRADVVKVAHAFGALLSPARISALASRAPGQVYTHGEPELDFMFLNSRRAPFDDPHVRRAVNYAVDRRRIARVAGGSGLAQMTCQYAAPGAPAYAPSCPYTADPGPGGGWTAPDLDRARRLVRRSGTFGTRVTMWGQADKRALVLYVVSVLRRLGYRTSVRWFPDFYTTHTYTADSRVGAQIGISGWLADYGAPSTFALPYLCRSFVPRSTQNVNDGEFCDPRIDALNDQALAARGADAEQLWREVYRRLDHAAPGIPLVNRRSMALVSKRVGNYQHHPMFGPLLDQLWVR